MTIFARPRVGDLSRDGTRIRVAMPSRTRNTYIVLATIFFVGLGVALYVNVEADTELEALAPILFYALPALFLILFVLYKAIFDPFIWEPTPEEQYRQLEAIRSTKPEKSIFEYAWYIRYALAAVGSWFLIYWLIPRFGDDWSWMEWLMLIMYGSGILALARELAIVLIVVGGILIAVNWVSDFKLTTPSAILIGAIVIAYAISQSNRRQ